MANNLLKLFGKLRRFAKDHADEGFQITSSGEKIRIERRRQERRIKNERRVGLREFSIDRRVNGLERRLGVDWRAY